MRSDHFFTQTTCDRCGAELARKARIMSWFTDETICTDVCSAAERELRKQLREAGHDDLKFEGCGYVPDPASPERSEHDHMA